MHKEIVCWCVTRILYCMFSRGEPKNANSTFVLPQLEWVMCSNGEWYYCSGLLIVWANSLYMRIGRVGGSSVVANLQQRIAYGPFFGKIECVNLLATSWLTSTSLLFLSCFCHITETALQFVSHYCHPHCNHAQCAIFHHGLTSCITCILVKHFSYWLFQFLCYGRRK